MSFELQGTPADAPEEFESVALRDVYFVMTPNEMKVLAEFLSSCAAGAATHDWWEHEHLQDFLPDRDYSGPDVIVYRKPD